jgi:rubredoxin
MKYICELCGYIYSEEKGDPARGILPGTKLEDLPEDYECPCCGFGKEAFNPVP